MKKSLSAKKLALILIAVILLPALFFTANEFTSLNSSEKMLAEVYSRQLDAILYSVNQYAWDIANSWVHKIETSIQEGASKDFKKNLLDFLSKNQAVRAVFLSDSLVTRVKVFSVENKIASGIENQIQKTLSSQLSLIKKLNRFKRAGYQKIEPIFVEGNSSSQNKIALIFIPDEFRDEIQLVGMLLDNTTFIQNIIFPKLQEMAGNEFILAVLPENETDSVFTTEPTPLNQIKQKKQIWLFPNYYLGIRLKGQTVEELARSRFYRNLFLSVILDLILLIVIWFVYRNILKEIELARMKSDFVSNVSHELKTPLSLIRMFAETLEMNRVASQEKKQEYYRVISQETERLTHLVNNILNFSRIEAGRKEYNFQTIELNDLVKKVLENYNYHLRQNGFEVKMKLAEKLPAVKVDEESLSEALLNLIDNAIKYSHDEKFIAVKTGIDDSTVFLEVEDHGIGIDHAQKEKIFDKFYRVSGGLVHNTKGSGLGLTLVRNIMDAHNGKVKVDSQIGKGSRFTLYLPKVINDHDQITNNQ